MYRCVEHTCRVKAFATTWAWEPNCRQQISFKLTGIGGMHVVTQLRPSMD